MSRKTKKVVISKRDSISYSFSGQQDEGELCGEFQLMKIMKNVSTKKNLKDKDGIKIRHNYVILK